jgi:hypothetical protein
MTIQELKKGNKVIYFDQELTVFNIIKYRIKNKIEYNIQLIDEDKNITNYADINEITNV